MVKKLLCGTELPQTYFSLHSLLYNNVVKYISREIVFLLYSKLVSRYFEFLYKPFVFLFKAGFVCQSKCRVISQNLMYWS